MSAVLLPGDLVSAPKATRHPAIVEVDGNYATKVIAKVGDDGYKAFKHAVVPQVKDVVIARVVRARRKEAHLVLLTTNGQPLSAPLLAELRAVDVREKDVDSVVVSDFCKPGDLVRGRVVALGRSGFYAQLATTEDEFGVVQLENNKQ